MNCPLYYLNQVHNIACLTISLWAIVGIIWGYLWLHSIMYGMNDWEIEQVIKEKYGNQRND